MILIKAPTRFFETAQGYNELHFGVKNIPNQGQDLGHEASCTSY